MDDDQFELELYNRQGERISRDEWLRLRSDNDNRIVARDYVGEILISTVWLGLDHNWGDGPPHIFETMAFPSEDNLNEMYMERYATEDDALEGHSIMVRFIEQLEGEERNK